MVTDGAGGIWACTAAVQRTRAKVTAWKVMRVAVVRGVRVAMR